MPEYQMPIIGTVKTAADLKRLVEANGHAPHFFTRSTMKFFGDRMSNYGVRQPVKIKTNMGEEVMAYELVRRRPVKEGNQGSAWFNAATFARVFPEKD